MNIYRLTALQHQPATTSVVCRFCCLLLWVIILSGTLTTAYADHIGDDSVDEAISLRKHGQVFAAIAMLKRLKSQDVANVRVNLELAVSHLKAKQYDQAQDDIANIYEHAPTMKQNPRLRKLCDMLNRSQQRAKKSKHQFIGEFTSYRGFDEITSEFPYFEITEYEDYYQVERKSDKIKSKFHYLAGRLKGEYRYTPTESFNLFGQPTNAFWSNRMTYFHKQTLHDQKVRFGFASLDSSVFVVQPKRWAFNAKIKGKWHTYQGEKTLTEQSLDINGSVLFLGARLKLGVSHKKDDLNTDFADDAFGDDYYIYEQKISVTSPYAKLSYRFSPSLLWSLGTRKRNIHADNPLLEGDVTNYNSTLKYNVSDTFDLYISYYQDDLHYDSVDLDLGLNSGEMKKTITFGGGYYVSENWQVGINALYVDKRQYDDFGQDQWKRLEGYVRYRF